MLAALVCVLLAPQFEVVIAAYERHSKATSVYGELKVESFGQEEKWTFWRRPQAFTYLATPCRITLTQPGSYVVYHRFNKSKLEQHLDGGSMMQIPELWPFWNVGRPNSAGYGNPLEKPTKSTFDGKACWALAGIPIVNTGSATLYFEATDGALLGWRVDYTSPKHTDLVHVAKLEWNRPQQHAPWSPPPSKAILTLDDLMFLPPGKRVPDAPLVDEAGKKTTLYQQLKGSKGALVSIAFVGCGPCERVKDYAQRHFAALQSAGIKFIPLEANSEAKDLAALVKEHPMPFPTYLTGGEDDFYARFRVAGAPTLYFLDSKGRVLKGVQGYDPEVIAENLTHLGVSELR